MATQFKDYYQVLGVTKKASQEDIRKAFRQLARKHHPDVAKDKVVAESKFKEINEAYEVLGDPEKRQRYDALGANWEQGQYPPPPQGRGRARGAGMPGDYQFGGTGFSDFFEQFFGGQAHGGEFPRSSSERGRSGGTRRGEDVEADLMVTLEEALHGAQRKISLQRNGTQPLESYVIKIPKGVYEGQRIRLSSQGEKGSNGGTAGDLYLKVKFARHPDFQFEGDNLVRELSLMPWQAVLGDEQQVPTPEGAVRLKIPAGTQTGKKFRLRQKGLPTKAGSRGDLIVSIVVEIPQKVTEEERALWQKLADKPNQGREREV